MLPRKPSPSAHVMCGLGPACSVLWGKEHNPFGGILLVGGWLVVVGGGVYYLGGGEGPSTK